MHWLSQTRTNGRYNAFAAPSPPRDWHGGPFPTHGELAQAQWDQPGQQAPYVFSHRSDQKPGYRQVPVRIFWSALRYVFKNSARYIIREFWQNSVLFATYQQSECRPTTTRVLPTKYKINDESRIEIRKFAKKIVHILGKLSFHWLFILRNCYTSEMMIKTADSAC